MFDFASNRVLAEQLRLVHKNGPVSFLGSGLGIFLLLWGLAYSSPADAPMGWGAPVAWAVTAWLFIGLTFWLSALVTKDTQLIGHATYFARMTVVLFTAYGGVWGALSWVVPGAMSPLSVLLIIAFSSGMLGGAQSFMTPLWPAYAGFVVALLVPLSVRLLLDAQMVHFILGIACLVSLYTKMGQSLHAARTFREMIDLRFANVELVDDLRAQTEAAVSARLAAEKARACAEDANLAKSKFLAAASHDLRQPMQAQGMFLEVLAHTRLDTDQLDLVTHARAACLASGEMLNTLLDFSRVEAGVIKLQTQAFRVQAILHKLEVELAPQADAKWLLYRSRDTHAVVRSDPALVELILRNIVSNAIRYTESGGVLVGCRTRGPSLDIEVWDTGIGIAPEHQAEVFREFHQLGNPERDRRKGLGLGLSIASGLAVQLGHALTLKSTPGRGTVFRLTLPLTDEPPLQASLPSSSSAASLTALKVLVIDDDDTVRLGMSRLLQSWGCECLGAEGLDEALAATRLTSPDIVICDYRLREQRTGAQVILALRALHGDDLPAILITGDTALERLREAQASGMPLMHKPVAPTALRQKMIEVLSVRTSSAEKIL